MAKFRAFDGASRERQAGGRDDVLAEIYFPGPVTG